MLITHEEIHILAAEAKLKITQEEMPAIIKYLCSFLAELERMNELELTDVPLFSFQEIDSCPMREDVIVDFPHSNDLLRAAPLLEGNYFRVSLIT
jgi:aspartyl/glutamyl-tRNA(Asn/Gln) amidotransferase C subunit